MVELPITLTTASVLGLMFVWLSARVIGGRVQGQVLIGDAGDVNLVYRIRTHGNFSEYVPIFLIILGLTELSGGNATVLTVLASFFVLARILHVPGMGENANIRLRQAGMIGTFLALVIVSLYGLYLAVLA